MPAAGTDNDLYSAVSRCSLKRSAAMRALDSSCRGMLLMSEEKGLSGFSRLISQLVFPGEDRAAPLKSQASTSHWLSPWAPPRAASMCAIPNSTCLGRQNGPARALRLWSCPPCWTRGPLLP